MTTVFGPSYADSYDILYRTKDYAAEPVLLQAPAAACRWAGDGFRRSASCRETTSMHARSDHQALEIWGGLRRHLRGRVDDFGHREPAAITEVERFTGLARHQPFDGRDMGVGDVEKAGSAKADMKSQRGRVLR
jgi:hypothetical protein